MKAAAAIFCCLVLAGDAPGARMASGLAGAARSSDVGPSALAPAATPAENAARLRRIFATRGATTLKIAAGTYRLPCGSSFTAAGSLSILGAGADRTILKLDRACIFDRPLMAWTSKSNVHLSGFTIDLAGSRSRTRQNVLQFQAYDGNAAGLHIDHIAIVNGNTLSLQVAVAAAGGFSYSGVVIDGNRLQMTPGRSQNQCIALSTVNGAGRIPSARITNNVCRGSGIQADGEGTLVAGNDVSGYQFGTGIFTAFVQRAARGPSSRDCVIRDNILHDTPQTLDVNRTAPGGIENNCVNALIENNQALNLGGAGFFNFASGARFVGNRAGGVGYAGRGSAGGDADNAAYAVFDNGSGMPWYRSSGVVFEGNSSEPQGDRPRYGYFEEPWHLFSAVLRGNDFKAHERAMLVRSASCRAAPARC
jgi:hypothetical protein